MESRTLIGWGMILAGLGLGVAGYLRLRRQALGLGFQAPKGRLVTKNGQPTPVVEEWLSPSGMRVQHRRSAHMSIEDRVANIQEKVWQSVTDPEMRKLALQITRNCPERDGECEARAIYKAIKKRVRYTGDVAPLKVGGKDGPVEPIDLYQSAKRTWEFGGGDCDDHAIISSTLLTLNGVEARLRVTAEAKGAEWGHVYTVAGTSPKIGAKKWCALDTTLPGDSKFCYEVPYAKHLDFPV